MVQLEAEVLLDQARQCIGWNCGSASNFSAYASSISILHYDDLIEHELRDFRFVSCGAAVRMLCWSMNVSIFLEFVPLSVAEDQLSIGLR